MNEKKKKEFELMSKINEIVKVCKNALLSAESEWRNAKARAMSNENIHKADREYHKKREDALKLEHDCIMACIEEYIARTKK